MGHSKLMKNRDKYNRNGHFQVPKLQPPRHEFQHKTAIHPNGADEKHTQTTTLVKIETKTAE